MNLPIHQQLKELRACCTVPEGSQISYFKAFCFYGLLMYGIVIPTPKQNIIFHARKEAPPHKKDGQVGNGLSGLFQPIAGTPLIPGVLGATLFIKSNELRPVGRLVFPICWCLC